jgi:S-adenosylmethionine hydrolase
VFAPAAAHLARGVGIEGLGPALDPDSLVRLPSPEAEPGAPELVTRIVHVDHYGSLVTEVTRELLDTWLAGRDPGGIVIEAGSTVIAGLSRTFADVAAGEFLALWGSGGRLEVAVNRSSAAAALGLRRGDLVGIRLAGQRRQG